MKFESCTECQYDIEISTLVFTGNVNYIIVPFYNPISVTGGVSSSVQSLALRPRTADVRTSVQCSPTIPVWNHQGKGERCYKGQSYIDGTVPRGLLYLLTMLNGYWEWSSIFSRETNNILMIRTVFFRYLY